MLIAVTGGTGFVGRHVLARLGAGQHRVRALVRRPLATPSSNITAIQGDLFNRDALADLCEGADAVLHVAGAVSGSAGHMQQVNVAGTEHLLRAADTAGVKRLIHVSSLAAREPHLSAYGHSKADGERAVRAASRSISTLIIRPPAIYGEGDKATLPLLKALLSRTAVLPGSRLARFSLLHADDLAQVCIDALSSPVEDMREVDDGHGAYGWQDVAATTRALCGRPARVHFIPRRLAMSVGYLADGLSALTRRPGMVSAGKMRELYHADWVARPPGWPRNNPIALRDGMHRTLTWAMAQGLLPRLPLADRSAAP